MADQVSSATQDAEVFLSGGSNSVSDLSPAATSDGGSPESSREIRQVLSELLSGNTVIPSKNRVK
jgi:hypothetical protein